MRPKNVELFRRQLEENFAQATPFERFVGYADESGFDKSENKVCYDVIEEEDSALIRRYNLRSIRRYTAFKCISYISEPAKRME